MRSDSGEVVKRHPTREKALAHLRALKANVEEGPPAVLGVLIEGVESELRDASGRWMRGATSERHGAFKIGDRVKFETGSRAAGGHGPVTFTTQPGVHEVVGFQRNGNLRLREPEHGTTVDVHHTHASKVGPLHPEYRGAMVQQDYARDREKIAREAAARARTPRPRVRESAPEVLGVLLEGAEERVQEAIGAIEKGAFHRWLGKKQGEPITDADIAKGLAAGGHPAKMAQFAKAARKFGK